MVGLGPWRVPKGVGFGDGVGFNAFYLWASKMKCSVGICRSKATTPPQCDEPHQVSACPKILKAIWQNFPSARAKEGGNSAIRSVRFILTVEISPLVSRGDWPEKSAIGLYRAISADIFAQRAFTKWSKTRWFRFPDNLCRRPVVHARLL